MAFMDLCRPEWKHGDPAIRKAAVAQLVSEAILAESAKTDKDAGARLAARSERDRLRRERLGEPAKLDVAVSNGERLDVDIASQPHDRTLIEEVVAA